MAASAPSAPPAARAPAASAGAVRMFGRFQLLRLLGKSARSMLWLALDSRGDREMMLSMPRVQLHDERAMAAWQQRVRRATRLSHPHLAPIAEVGEHDHWPFVAYERGDFATWPERIGGKGLPATDMAAWCVQVLQGLAFAHEAGMAHRDLQPFSLLADEAGRVLLLGLEVAELVPLALAPAAAASAAAGATAGAGATGAGPAAGASGNDAHGGQAAMDERTRHRQTAEADVLAFGLVAHQLLAGTPPLEEPDIARVMARMPPHGTEIVRLPYTVPRPIPEPLRAIVNRATDRQERQRYRSARTFERAIEGWLKAGSEQDAGPISLLLDRMRAVGLLPAMPGGADRAARLAMMERGHTSELSDIVLQDLGLAFELLRSVNLAQSQAGNAGNGPVLATHRAVAMLGLDGVRRAALSLRGWPGPLNDANAAALEALIARVKRAGNLARRLQPAGYDTEVVFLLTALQNLGWLAVQYHFPDEATQIRRLMQPAPSPKPGQPDEPGMSAEAASFAVLGVDIEALGTAVMKHWGLDDGVQHLVRRLPPTGAVRAPEGDDELLRTVASCANETMDALAQPARTVMAAMQRVVQRYGRVLDFTLPDLQENVQALGGMPAMEALLPGAEPATLTGAEMPPPSAPAASADRAASPGMTAPAPAGGLRARARAAADGVPTGSSSPRERA